MKKNSTVIGGIYSVCSDQTTHHITSVTIANAIAILIPCHRVIGSDGALAGYSGGLPAKKRLLQLEQSRSLL